MDILALDALHRDLIRALRDPGSEPAVLNASIARILHPQDGVPATNALPDYVGDLPTAMGLLPQGTWFRWNHFGFQVVPNRPMAGDAWSNALDHYPKDGPREGAPVAYEVAAYDSEETRRNLPRLVLGAILMARRAAILKERARREGRYLLVQTGQGPLAATPEGQLQEIASDTYLTADGRLVPHDPALHGGARIEAPDA